MKWILLLGWAASNGMSFTPNSPAISAPTQIGPFATEAACKDAENKIVQFLSGRRDQGIRVFSGLNFSVCIPVELAP